MPEINDIFGIKPYGDSLKIAVEKSANGVGQFLSAICMPAATEFGLMLNDKMRYWRLNNIIKMINKSQDKYEFISDKLQLKLNPRIGVEIIENASWQDNELILDMWAGLLASSVDKNDSDDSNLIFIQILKSLTGLQCRILNHICKNSKVIYDKNGLIYTETSCEISLEKLFEISETNDINRLDREIDHLRSLELLPSSSFLSSGSGFTINQEDFTKVTFEPTPLALHLFSKVNGHKNINDCFAASN
ncbi:Abi-alpha family protein [Carboxylicivirga taeanensis]|uniref:Abi-alpha family protein n=1 Tax=Carboxylicivirga taeanensis TaxID=1416875 RepID=UPI003F6E07B3